MRKRGLEPNERTFTHLLSAYGKSNSPQAIKNAEAWIKKMKDFNIEPTTIHMNNLMRVYNNADRPEKAIAALKDMSANGDLVPDAVSYSIALQGCVNLDQFDRIEQVRYIWHEIIYRMERNQRSHTTGMSSLSKKASEVIWSEGSIRKNTRDTELEVDDTLVVALLSAVTRTAANEKDVLIGIEAIDRLYSLCPPRAAQMMERNTIQRKSGFGFQPSVKVLDAILRFSGGLREFKLGEEYFNLTLQQFPRLEPDKYVYEAYSWIEKQLKRRKNFEKKRQYQTSREEEKR
jgi:pentatricopeptide repeat protein